MGIFACGNFCSWGFLLVGIFARGDFCLRFFTRGDFFAYHSTIVVGFYQLLFIVYAFCSYKKSLLLSIECVARVSAAWLIFVLFHFLSSRYGVVVPGVFIRLQMETRRFATVAREILIWRRDSIASTLSTNTFMVYYFYFYFQTMSAT